MHCSSLPKAAPNSAGDFSELGGPSQFSPLPLSSLPLASLLFHPIETHMLSLPLTNKLNGLVQPGQQLFTVVVIDGVRRGHGGGAGTWRGAGSPGQANQLLWQRGGHRSIVTLQESLCPCSSQARYKYILYIKHTEKVNGFTAIFIKK